MIVSADTETFLIEPYVKAPRLVCISMSAAPGADGLVHAKDALASASALFDQHTSVWLNGAFDCGVLAQHFSLMPKVFEAYASDRVTDVGIRERLFDIARGALLRPGKGVRPYSLASIAERVLGKHLSKGEDTWRSRYSELADVPLDQWPADARDYATNDAATNREIYEAQNARPYAAEILAPEFREARAAWWLHLVNCWGFRTDQARLSKFAREVGEEYDRLEELLIQEGLILVKKIGGKNPRVEKNRSVLAVRERVERVATQHGVAIKPTKSGDVATDADICKQLGDYDPPLRAYARLSSLSTLRSKDIPAFEGKPQIHPRFEVLQTNGRTSSYDPNVQNLPRIVGPREVVVPRPGCVLIDNDYPQIELRTWAQICIWLFGQSRMAEVLNSDTENDPHIELAGRILGTTYADTAAQIKAEKKARRDNPTMATPANDARQIAKPGNFGYLGGMGARTFPQYAREQFDIIMSDRKAEELLASWKATWPEADRYFAWIRSHRWTVDSKLVGKRTTIKHFVSGMIRGGALYTDACNNYFSGLAQVIAKRAGFEIARECYDETRRSTLFGCRTINFIHDQFLVEVPLDDLSHDRAMRVADIMDLAAREILPDIRTKTEPCLAMRWSKNAEPIYDSRGRLLPWEEKAA